MSDEVEEELIGFIRKFGHLDNLSITWFGVPFSAGIVTNGYLLDSSVVFQLLELRIQ